MKKTKVICTLGPATAQPRAIAALERLGADVIRLNTAFGSLDDLKKMAKAVRSASQMPILFDLKGPDMRVYVSDERDVCSGDKLELGVRPDSPNRLNHPIMKFLKSGDRLTLNAGRIRCMVESSTSRGLQVRALNDGRLKDGSSLHAPGKDFKLPALSKKDLQVVALANQMGEAVFALSYSRSAQDIAQLRKRSPNAVIVAKIESQAGVENIDEIAAASDAVMIARGDLGIELPVEKLPHLQRQLIEACRRQAKACIVATQMLESMMDSPIPTRAEVSDIACAINDGADALMLSGETAIGRYPMEALRVLVKTAVETERHSQDRYAAAPATIDWERTAAQAKSAGKLEPTSEALSLAVRQVAQTTPVDWVVTPTRSGHTARMISRLHLPVPVIAPVENRPVARQLAFYYGVRPVELGLRQAGASAYVKALLQKGLVEKNQTILMTLGTFSRQPMTDTLHLIDLKKTNGRR